MNQQQLNDLMGKAVNQCSHSGARLTTKRKRILTLLFESAIPLSAYEVVAAYKLRADDAIPPMSVYRILDFLVSEGLAHKLTSNKYVACSHIDCDHRHDIPQFLVCGQCQQVKEITIDKAVMKALGRQLGNVGYRLVNSPLELDCICAQCAADTAQISVKIS